MRTLWLLRLSLFLVPLSAGAAEPIVVYVYDSFFSGEARTALTSAIQAKSGHPVKWVVTGDAGQVVSRHQLDLRRKHPRAHLLIGIDNATLSSVAEDALAVSEKQVPALAQVDPKLRVDPKLIPYNYGVLAFMVDTERLPKEQWPSSWDDLLKPHLKKKIILEDPRTSTPGLGFVMASREVWKEKFQENWKKLRAQWLTLTPGWSQAYGLFRKGEAPLVWSYATSQAYHQLGKQPTSRYQALIFSEGNPLQIEGIVVPGSSPGGEAMRKAALAAAEVILSEKIQSQIPLAQWMFPARKGIELPWTQVKPPVPEPRRILSPPSSGPSIQETLKLWSEAIR